MEMNLLDKYKDIRDKNVAERIMEPQGHMESPDRISDDSKKNGVSPKKQMGNKTPLDIIAKILSGNK